jgi:ABC-type phosphate transport system substrate-binding protein
MRMFSKLLAGSAAALAVVALTAGPALADPPGKTVPKPGDVVGVGSDTIQNVMNQFSHDFNATHSKGPKLYSWDATNPKTGAINDPIVTKKGCKAIPRPDGSSAGITALTTQNASTSGHPCMDFARSSRDRASTDPSTISFVDLAGDAVTYATQPGTHAPSGGLTTAQLTAIYECKVTNWSQVGGSSGPIHAFIPQSGSGTAAFFLAAIAVTTPGSCVSSSATKTGSAGHSDNTLEENEGVAASLNKSKADVIFPFSVGKYIAERYHSAKCLNSKCTANSSGVVCKPSKSQNLFGCDTHGTMALNKINGTAPSKPFPLTNSSKNPVINPGFTAGFQRTLFEVVRSPESGGVGSIPTYLKPFFGPTGWVCSTTAAKTDLKNYGFRVLKAGPTAGDCGSAH